MNLQEDYCSHELTKLLLEKGCPLEKVRRQDGRPVYYTLPKDHPNWADCGAYYIPTHAQIMKWLREKGIYLNIRYVPNSDIDNIGPCYVVDIANNNEGRWVSNNIVTDTYEEAVEAAIKYSLEKLV